MSLVSAVKNGDYNNVNLLIETIKTLIEAGEDVNEKERPLVLAAEKGNIDIVKLLLEHGADVNGTESKYGSAPLHFAAQKGYLDVVKLLLDYGADINQLNDQGTTPLHFAAEGGNIDIVKLLLEEGAEDINDTNDHGNTPLNFAAINGHIDVVKLLVESGANVNGENNHGVTSLLFAVWKSRIHVVKLLIQSQANVNQTNKYGDTPFNWATKNGNRECIELLLDAGGALSANILYPFPPNTETTGKVVIGLNLNGQPVTRHTPGFEKAITNMKELNEAIISGEQFNRAIIKTCDYLAANKDKRNQRNMQKRKTMRAAKSQLFNLCSLFLRCSFEVKETELSLLPTDIVEKIK
jgi:ankyrin repeat protein